MTQTSRPWNGTGIGDAGPYTDAQWQSLYRRIIGWGAQRPNVGIFLGSGTQPDDGLKVQAQAGPTTSIDVLPGAALVQGIGYINTTAVSFAIAANASGNPRVDTVIIRADYALRTCRLAVLQGTPAATPSPAALTQSSNVMWEIPVADIAVANSFTGITDANITPRHEWVNAPPGVFLDNAFNNSGVTLVDGDVVVWDNTATRSVTLTTTLDDKATAGVWRGRTAAGGYGRVQTNGIGLVRVNAAVARGNLLTSSGTARQAAVNPGANNRVIGRAIDTTSVAGLALCHINVHTVRDEEYILIRDEKTSGTNAAALTLGGWRTRELNTEVYDTGNFASLNVGTGQITLEAGTYTADAGAPLSGANNHRSRLRNVTDNVTLLESPNENNGGTSRMTGAFTITAQKVIELQMWPGASTTGGTAITTGDTEKYGYVALTRKAETP